MKIQTTVKELKAKVGIVGHACGGSSVTNITKNVLIEAKDKICLTCYDEVKHITISTPLDGGTFDAKGEALIDCKMLQQVLSKLNDSEDISLEFNDKSQVIVRSGKSRVTLTVQDAAQFPRPSELPKANSNISVSSTILKDMVRDVIFAISTNDSNRIMTGVNIVKANGKLTMTALDGHRIAIRDVVVESGDDMNIIIEGELLKTAIDSLGDGVEVTIASSTSNVEFFDGKTTVACQLIAGNYFNISQFMGLTTDKSITLNKEELKNAIDRASIFLSQGDKKPVVFDIGNNSVNIAIKTMLGETSEDLSGNTTGEAITIAFNPKYLLDALKVIKDKDITLSMTNSKSPATIKGENYLHLVLPVNFK